MEDYEIRILDIIRLLPNEIERLHAAESMEHTPVDWDPVSKTCKGWRPRFMRCWTTTEIQDNFRKATLKDHYHLSGYGTFAQEQLKENVAKLAGTLRAAFFENAVVNYTRCDRCGWSQTLWDNVLANGFVQIHDEECSGRVYTNGVRELHQAARQLWTIGEVPAMHALDRVIVGRKDAVIKALSPFTDSKSKPKTRVQMIKEEAQKPLSLG